MFLKPGGYPEPKDLMLLVCLIPPELADVYYPEYPLLLLLRLIY